MGAKPEDYARHVISVLAPPDNFSKCDPGEDMHAIFDCLPLDAPLIFLVDKLAEKLSTIEVNKGSAERVIEDLNNRTQKAIETLRPLWQQDKGLKKSFCENNLILNVMSLLIRKYANMLTISTNGLNNVINSAAIDAGADDLCADDPVRSLTLVFHSFQSGLLTDVELSQFLMGQTKEVVDSAKDLMESLTSTFPSTANGVEMHELPAEVFGIDLTGLTNVARLLLECTKDTTHTALPVVPGNVAGLTLEWNRSTPNRLELDVNEMDYLHLLQLVKLKDVVFILLRGINMDMRPYKGHAVKLNRVKYLIEHFESFFDSIPNCAISMLEFALYVNFAACEYDVFGFVSTSTANRLSAFVNVYEHAELAVLDVYESFDVILPTTARFIGSVISPKGEGPKRYYDGFIIDEFVSYLGQHPSAPAFSMRANCAMLNVQHGCPGPV